MPNHFHLLLKQVKEGGIQEYIRKVLNSYTKYFNTKYSRVGPLFQDRFKDVPIETEEQLLHVSRYIHLNPFVAGMVKEIRDYPYSSYREFTEPTEKPVCKTQVIQSFFTTSTYDSFVKDQREYAASLEYIKHHLFDEDLY